MRNTIIEWLQQNQNVLLGSFVGGWIQLWFAKKKGVKFNMWFVISNFIMAMFVGYWAAVASTALGKPEWGTFVASWVAIASNSIMNMYVNNDNKIVKQIFSLVFKIKIDEEDK